jgi:hypothetical protein
LVTEADVQTQILGVTVLGTQAYWVELPLTAPPAPDPTTVKSVALLGGAASILASFLSSGDHLAVTATTVFLSGAAGLSSFPLASGVPDGGTAADVSGAMQGCDILLSDTDAIYCVAGSSISRIASDGCTTALGTVFNGPMAFDDGNTELAQFAFDDTYFYWVDDATVGTVMRVPKTGGTATLLARDTNPVAIAVDAHAVYWSDAGGNILRLAK